MPEDTDTRLWQLSWQLDADCTRHQCVSPVDWYPDRLRQPGVVSVWVEQLESQTFQYQPQQTPNWRNPILHALTASEQACDRLLLYQLTLLPELGTPTISHPDINTQIAGTPAVMRFGSLRVYTDGQLFADRVTKQPAIHIPAGLAFGTGTHPTTAMILNWCGDHPQLLKDASVLDYGCGSGILAIAAIALGAGTAVAVDHDPQAIESCTTNIARNNLHTRMRAYSSDSYSARDQGDRYQIIFANILLSPLLALADLLISKLQPGGTILLTGILQSQRHTLVQAYAGQLRAIDQQPTGKDGWELVVMQR